MFSFISLSTLVIAVILSLGEASSNWDYIVFSQSWPNTKCIEWKEASAGHYCILPKDMPHWIVHGLWPTKSGTSGPSFCPGVEFNQTALMPIENELEENWTNVEMPTDHYSFWEHEWEKHGRCAASLPDFSSELKYFSQGLRLLQKYNIASVLSGSGIVPGDKPLSAEQIYNAVFSDLNRVPSVHCILEKGTRKIFLSEIRMCVNKDLDVIDCEGGKVLNIVNCGVNQEEVVYYPSTVRTVREPSFTPPTPHPHWLYKLLYVLRLLVWFSL